MNIRTATWFRKSDAECFRLGDDRKNIFMVGDVKQNTSRFRLARPELFMEKYKSSAPRQTAWSRESTLHKNFRSRQEVLESVNFIFRRSWVRDWVELIMMRRQLCIREPLFRRDRIANS